MGVTSTEGSKKSRAAHPPNLNRFRFMFRFDFRFMFRFGFGFGFDTVVVPCHGLIVAVNQMNHVANDGEAGAGGGL